MGANKKIKVPIENALCVATAANQPTTYPAKLAQLSCLTTKNWDAFYDTARPLLPASVSDEELQAIYHFLQKDTNAYFDETAAPEKRLEVLLFFSMLGNRE